MPTSNQSLPYLLKGASAATPTLTGILASITGADQVNISGRGLLLHMNVAGYAGAATFTPVLQWKTPNGTYVTIWTAAAAVAANGDTLFALYPATLDAVSVTEHKAIILPTDFRINLTYSGNGTTDTGNVTMDAEIMQ